MVDILLILQNRSKFITLIWDTYIFFNSFLCVLFNAFNFALFNIPVYEAIPFIDISSGVSFIITEFPAKGT